MTVPATSPKLGGHVRTPRRRHRMPKTLTAALAAATIVATSAGTALAGEVTGPPGAGNVTPKPVNGHSICAFSGLNDFNQGPTDRITQSFGTDVAWHGADPRLGNPGDACRGGSN